MTKLSLKDRLVRYLEKNPSWHANGDLQRLVMQHTTYTPRTTARRLEELVNEGKLRVEYRKGHAFYMIAETPIKNFSMEKFSASLESAQEAMEAYWRSL